MATGELNPRDRQIDHVLRTRERQVERAERELAVMEDPLWIGKALIDAQMRMADAPTRHDQSWRGYAVKPTRVYHYLFGGGRATFISIGMIVEALDALVEQGLVTRGTAGDYWWAAEQLPE